MLPVALVLSLLVGATLGLLGGGGSILTLPILRYVLGMDAREAIAMSLVVVGVTSLAAMIEHARAGRVQWATGLWFGTASMIGAFAAGKWLSPLVPASALLVMFGVLMAITAVAMLRRKPAVALAAATDALTAPTVVHQPKIIRSAAVGIATGAMTGLIGAGGGFIVVPVLTLLGGVPMPQAIGTSLLVIVINSAAGFVGNAGHVAISWPTAGAVAAFAIAGSFVGASLVGRVSPAKLRRAFAWLVVAMACFMLLQEAPRQFHASLPIGLVVAISAAVTSLLYWLHQRLARPAVTPARALA